MPSNSPGNPLPNGDSHSHPGLPTVTPPSGGMFFRLFGVPALIVGGLVLLLIAGQPLIGKFGSYFLGRTWGSGSPEQFLRDLDNNNKEVRGRAASDLSQVLLRDDNLASNTDFALELAQRLRRTLDSSAAFERTHAEHAAKLSPEDETRETAKLEPDRDYIVFLTQCLSRFLIPIGVPLMEEMAVQKSGLDPLTLHARRRQALWALANLGENLKRFDRLSPDRQEAIETQLATNDDSGDRSNWAKDALKCLKSRREGAPTVRGVDRVVEMCADSDDPSLRELAAFLANFWSGTPGENARMEKTLVRLSFDSGKGEEDLERLEEQKPIESASLLGNLVEREQTRSLVKKKGFRVQANAAIALARQGSSKVRLVLLQTMLDEDELRGIFVLQSKKNATEQPDQAAVVETMLNTLKAIAELHRKAPQMDLSSLRSHIDRLAHNPNPAVQTEAGRVVLALKDSQ